MTQEIEPPQPGTTNTQQSWLRRKKDPIAALKDLLTIIGLISVAIGVFQLHATAANIKSNTAYQISHEGRDIARGIFPDMPSEKIGPVISYTYMVWKQHQLGTYDDELWSPFVEEVCEFMKEQKGFDQYWNERKKLFASDFAKLMDAWRAKCK